MTQVLMYIRIVQQFGHLNKLLQWFRSSNLDRWQKVNWLGHISLIKVEYEFIDSIFKV